MNCQHTTEERRAASEMYIEHGTCPICLMQRMTLSPPPTPEEWHKVCDERDALAAKVKELEIALDKARIFDS